MILHEYIIIQVLEKFRKTYHASQPAVSQSSATRFTLMLNISTKTADDMSTCRLA